MAVSRPSSRQGRSPGKGCLSDEQILRVQEPPITGDDVPSIQDHHVPWNDLLDWNLNRLSVPQDHRLDLDESQQFVHGVGRPPFLPEAKQAADQHNGEDQQSVGCLMQEERQRHCEEQD